MTNELIDDECWIMQNSWGRGAGWDGFYFVHTDLECDGGIVSSGNAVIPLFEKVETEAETSSGSGVARSFFALANLALLVMFA